MSPTEDIELLLSDVDGTLVTQDKQLTPAAEEAAKALRRAGIGLTLTSARPPRGIRMLVEPLDLRLPIAGFNGGLIVDHQFNILESHPNDPQAARAAVEVLRECRLDLWVYTEEEWYVTALDGPHVEREAWIIQMQPKLWEHAPGDSSSHHLDRAFKIVGVSDDHDRIAAAQARVTAQLGDAVSATSSEPHFLDITHPGATKGAVVHSLARRLDVPTSRIATIGDMPNDVLMFRESGFSIAMGNASDAVKDKASAVTDSNDNDGFAKAVHRYLLRSGER